MLFTPTEWAFADTLGRMAYLNPFDEPAQLAIRAELAAIDLGQAEAEQQRPPLDFPNFDSPTAQFADTYARRIEVLLEKVTQRLKAPGADACRGIRQEEIERYEDMLTCALQLRYFAPGRVIQAALNGERITQFKDFRRDLERWTNVPLPLAPYFRDAEHSFAIDFQYRLAIKLLEDSILGNSRPAERLRAALWHSIFPKALRLYGVLLFERMHDVTTLILGPSGTGKELVASAIGLARYVPFDAKHEQFVEPFAGACHALNLSAMPRDLIESEMFGHAAGAFTGATREREGWFEKCKQGHTVFLDELGELDESVQVRLLRVLQSREFYRVGDTKPRTFAGRVIAATNRNLGELIAAGQFREDLYFRLCSDVIHTPSLREQLDDSPDELPTLVQHIAQRCLGMRAAAEFVEQLTRDTLEWIEQSPAMGWSYAWPGNFRELEQCVRSVMVRGEYHPPQYRLRLKSTQSTSADQTSLDEFLQQVRAGSLTFDEVLVRYCSLMYARNGNMAQTARRLKKHRVTVQGRVDPAWVERFKNG